MGYRSCVAMMVYGDPEQVDMVDNLLLQRLNPEYDREMFERVKQVRDEDVGYGDAPKLKQRTIMWTFDDIKWYSEMQAYQSMVFAWVDEIESNREDDDARLHLCYEFVRVGEESNDIEEERSLDSDYRIYTSRKIEIPDNFEWRI